MKTKLTVINHMSTPEQPAVERGQFWMHNASGSVYVVHKCPRAWYTLVRLSDGKSWTNPARYSESAFGSAGRGAFTFLPEVTMLVGGVPEQEKPASVPKNTASNGLQPGDKVRLTEEYGDVPTGTEGILTNFLSAFVAAVTFPPFGYRDIPTGNLEKLEETEQEPAPEFKIGDTVETLCKWCGIPKGTQGEVSFIDDQGDPWVTLPNDMKNAYPAYCLKKI